MFSKATAPGQAEIEDFDTTSITQTLTD